MLQYKYGNRWPGVSHPLECTLPGILQKANVSANPHQEPMPNTVWPRASDLGDATFLWQSRAGSHCCAC